MMHVGTGEVFTPGWSRRRARGLPEGCLALLRVPWCIWTQSGCITGILRSPPVHVPTCTSSSLAVSYLLSDFWSVLSRKPGLLLPVRAWGQVLSWRARQLAGVDGFWRLNLPSSMLANTRGFLPSVQKWTTLPKDAMSWVGAVCLKKPHLLSKYGKHFKPSVWSAQSVLLGWYWIWWAGELHEGVLLRAGLGPRCAPFVQLLSCSQYQVLRC